MTSPKPVSEQLSYEPVPGQKPLDFQSLVPKAQTYAKPGTSPSNAAFLAGQRSANKQQELLDTFKAGGARKYKKYKNKRSRKQKGGVRPSQVVRPSFEPASATLGWNGPNNGEVLAGKTAEILLKAHNNNSANYCATHDCSPMDISKIPGGQDGGKRAKRTNRLSRFKRTRSLRKPHHKGKKYVHCRKTKKVRFALHNKQSRKYYKKIKKTRGKK
jgi:hypothetical protein